MTGKIFRAVAISYIYILDKNVTDMSSVNYINAKLIRIMHYFV
jgi:hypothetical protein